ncbi:glycosyltransferase family 2 protein [Paenibacillus sp. 1001270B_150601_E10]|uniref:glycosyltransferase family 2 protein n=1 Tax=Paenibacillus sp. 1001270B_150601_E10 TaxID=2787079 RepID=UPI00189F196E|nr:glycosyltransferase [Paenibacillus sp. 1001270B_150601_E10]
MLDVSIIIPVYNKMEQLERSLYFVANQIVDTGIALEVVVIDDGSTEPVKDIIDSYSNQIHNLKYIYLERDKHSCRSRTRNVGIRESSGRILVFLDCGIVIPDFFIERVVSRIGDSENMVLYHYVMGAFTDPIKEDLSIIEHVEPWNLAAICEQLRYHPEWEDMRTSHFELVDHDLNRMDAPWSMGWGGAVSASREIVLQAGGFDETLKGWGAEDTDFAYQLHKHGASMYATDDICTLHLPHPSDDNIDQKIKSSYLNRKKMHMKHRTFDTEIYPYSADLHFDLIMAKFNRLVTHYYVPAYSDSLIELLNREYIQGVERSAIIGADSHAILSALKVSHVFLQNKGLLERYQGTWPEKEFVYLLGLDTLYVSKHFDVIIVTDYFRMFSEPLIGIMLKELYRISKKVVFLYNDSYVSYLATTAGWTWHSRQELEQLFERSKLMSHTERQVGDCKVFEVGKAVTVVV